MLTSNKLDEDTVKFFWPENLSDRLPKSLVLGTIARD